MAIGELSKYVYIENGNLSKSDKNCIWRVRYPNSAILTFTVIGIKIKLLYNLYYDLSDF